MIKALISRLFLSNKKRNNIIKDLKGNSSFRTKEEIQNQGTDSKSIIDYTLEKGKVETIFTPDLGNQKGLTLKKWFFKNGDIVKHGDVVCLIENENIEMEFESYFNGRIISTCKLNARLTIGMEIFKVEGI